MKEEFLPSPENPQFDPLLVNSDPHEPALIGEPFPTQLAMPPARTPKAGENPVWSFWDVLVLAGLTLLTLFVTQLLIVLVAWHFIYPRLAWIDVAQKPVLALLSELVTYGLVTICMFLLVEGKYRARFWTAVRWNWPGVAGVSLLGIGVLMLGFDFLTRFLPMPKTTPFDLFFAHRSDAYLTAAFAVTLGPFMEELFFRGFLYPVLARRMGAVWGIVLTALPFGLMHYVQYRSWAAVLIIVLVGVVLTTIRAMTKSVASSFLAHIGYNGALMSIAVVATDGFKHMDKAGVLLF